MTALTVLYDASCDLCRGARAWLGAQPKYVELYFIAAGSAVARQRFPEIDPASTMREITVVDDEGQVYRGAKAWVMCLWALREYRSWALKFAAPQHMPKARAFVSWVSRNRSQLGGAGWFLRQIVGES